MLTPSHALDSAAPRCRMCPLPARWVVPRSGPGGYGSYCAGMSCTSRVRICQSCTRKFDRDSSGAGSKYCSTGCKIKGYHPKVPALARLCAWCAAPSPRPRSGRELWPYVCPDCLEPLRHVVGRLRKHRVPLARVRQLLSAPGCEICDVDLLQPVLRTGGNRSALLVVDHDHACCPGERSCGVCVRGFLCGNCNSAIGLLGDSVDVALRASAYLGGR